MDFQKLLLDVGKALSKDEVKALSFLCTDILNRNPTCVESAGDLFSRLGDKDHLSAERPYLLTELLIIIQRTRLIRDLGLSDRASETRSLISPYRTLLYNLSEEINDAELKDVKFLLNNYLPRRKLDENVSTLELFLEMEHMELISDNNLNLLETIFQSVCPMLNVKISQFKALQVTQTSPVAQESYRPRSKSYPVLPDKAPQSLNPERTASCELPEFAPLAESNMNTSSTSVDLDANVFHGGDDCVALSHQLSGLNTETSPCASLDGHLDVQENKVSSETQMPQTTNTNNEALGIYPMTAAKRGICLIVNNYNFNSDSHQKREGTILDEECLDKVFAWLGFVVEIKRDCKSEEMLSVLRELGSRNHSLMDCLVCCILSHGKEGCVFGVDGNHVPIKELTKPFNGLNCTSLADKPKLFFIQACQGTIEQKAVNICTDGPARSDDSIPSDADFLLGMATVPSFVSFRDIKKGTWYIQSLCQNLVQMVPMGSDLVSILTKVNADVSQMTKSVGVRKQMPQPAFSLRKKVVFPIPEAPPPSLPH
ncbi:caspase-8 isoform X3 [Cyclopterus lumpus]|uniref:caspase-8 isoform X3 n=1 Tax=Cyclopterus lumpus TaxID=8103 RepID=UPI0014861385|nr:caspase-8 isoform X3 [Cyclopterus lumpus]